MTQSIFISLILLCSFVLIPFCQKKLRPVIHVLIIGWLFRVMLLFGHYYEFFRIPGGDADAAAFTRHAKYLVELPWPQMLQLFDPMHAFNGYAWYGALIMRVVGYHALIMPALNLLAGMVGLIFSALLVRQLWGWRAAKIATWVVGLYPFAAFNSAIALREEFAITAFIIGLYYILRCARNQSALGGLIAVVFLGVATTIHAGFLGALVGVALFAGVRALRAVGRLVVGKGLAFSKLVEAIGSFAGLGILIAIIAVGGGVKIGKGITVGGEGGGAALVEAIDARFEGDSRGDSAYPSVIAVGDPFAQPWLIPARAVYFLFSPFPWDIRNAKHLFGFVSTFLYMFLFYRIYKGWSSLKQRPEHEVMFFMLIGLTLVFSIGVTNIGTAIRHKTKFLVLIVAMAGSTFTSLRSRPKI